MKLEGVSLSWFDMNEISPLSVVVVQGISKGVVVESLLSSMVRGGKAPDFVLCIGDDRSDEDMFESIVCPANGSVKLPATSEVFACTVGKKPSMAKYYLDDTVDVIKMLQGLASAPSQQRPWPVQLRVTFEEGNGV
uniref:Trehalose 6-phosphate phosphatase n=1 Tax=Aegilops tauschii subsp. strangulata TaxID=200361 RepID=A0A453PV22_AEGTS